MTRTGRTGSRGNALLVATAVSGLFALVGMLAEQRSAPAPVQPVDSVTTDDLARAADALEALAATRLTPAEERQVEEVAEIVDGLAEGSVTIAPDPRPTTTPVPAPRGPATTSTVAVTQPHAHLDAEDWADRWATTTAPATTAP